MKEDIQKEPEDPIDDWDEGDDSEDSPDYYYCYSCFYSTVVDHGGWGCPRCSAIMSPEYY